MGEFFTDADLRLFPTIVRYDAVYSCLFKCTRYRIKADFPNIQAWMQDVWLIGNDFELGSLRVSSLLLSVTPAQAGVGYCVIASWRSM